MLDAREVLRGCMKPYEGRALAKPKIRSTIVLTERQWREIDAEAKRLDISGNDMIRRIIDGWLDQPSMTQDSAPQIFR